MEFIFKDLPSYLSAKALIVLVYSHIENWPNKNLLLKSRIEKRALSIASNIARATTIKPDKSTNKIIDVQIQSLGEISALYDIAFEKKLVQKQDVEAIENTLQTISENLLKLENILNEQYNDK